MHRVLGLQHFNFLKRFFVYTVHVHLHIPMHSTGIQPRCLWDSIWRGWAVWAIFSHSKEHEEVSDACGLCQQKHHSLFVGDHVWVQAHNLPFHTARILNRLWVLRLCVHHLQRLAFSAVYGIMFKERLSPLKLKTHISTQDRRGCTNDEPVLWLCLSFLFLKFIVILLQGLCYVWQISTRALKCHRRPQLSCCQACSPAWYYSGDLPSVLFDTCFYDDLYTKRPGCQVEYV